jgi:hypothetical protein
MKLTIQIPSSYEGKESELIISRARAIATRRPDIANALMDHAEAQMAEYEYIDENFVSAIWVLERSHR